MLVALQRICHFSFFLCPFTSETVCRGGFPAPPHSTVAPALPSLCVCTSFSRCGRQRLFLHRIRCILCVSSHLTWVLCPCFTSISIFPLGFVFSFLSLSVSPGPDIPSHLIVVFNQNLEPIPRVSSQLKWRVRWLSCFRRAELHLAPRDTETWVELQRFVE